MRDLLDDLAYLCKHFLYYLPVHRHYKSVSSKDKSS